MIRCISVSSNSGRVIAGSSVGVILSRSNDHIRRKHLSTLCEENDKIPNLTSPKVIPTRSEQINNLSSKKFDILVVGGGATGCGAALDAASRGLSTALIEKGDFGTETSARSTKLLWVSSYESFRNNAPYQFIMCHLIFACIKIVLGWN